MNTTTEFKQTHQSCNEGRSIGADVTPIWAKFAGKHQEFDSAYIPENMYGDEGYFGILRSPDETLCGWLTPDVLPEGKFLLVVSKESLYDAAKAGFRGFELHAKKKGDGESAPVVRLANRFEFHARCLISFVGSASALGSIPVLFADANQDCFLIRYEFGTEAFIALHELAAQMVSV